MLQRKRIVKGRQLQRFARWIESCSLKPVEIARAKKVCKGRKSFVGAVFYKEELMVRELRATLYFEATRHDNSTILEMRCDKISVYSRQRYDKDKILSFGCFHCCTKVERDNIYLKSTECHATFSRGVCDGLSEPLLS